MNNSREKGEKIQSEIANLENKSHKTPQEQAKLSQLKTELSTNSKPAVEGNKNNQLLYWGLGIIAVGLVSLLGFLVFRKKNK